VSLAEFVYTVLLEPRPVRAAANAVLRAIARPSVTVHDARIVLNPRDPVISGALTLNVYERAETRVFLQLLRPGAVLLDVGANVGYYTALGMRALGPAGKVIALEPDPESFSFLQQTVQANSGAPVLCINKAAGRESGTGTLFTSTENRGDNRMYSNQLADSSCAVEIVSIDELLAELGVRQVDIVKIDVQGFEHYVLAGMRHTFAASRDVAMMMEFWPSGISAARSDPGAVLEMLEAQAFRLFEILPSGAVQRLNGHNDLIRRYPDRHYANLLALKGAELPLELRDRTSG